MGKANMAYRFVLRKKTNENRSAKAKMDAKVPQDHGTLEWKDEYHKGSAYLFLSRLE